VPNAEVEKVMEENTKEVESENLRPPKKNHEEREGVQNQGRWNKA
jgi:hypothetical protein